MLKASLSETDLEMSADELEILVNATLKQVAPEMPDGITFDMYMAYATAKGALRKRDDDQHQTAHCAAHQFE